MPLSVSCRSGADVIACTMSCAYEYGGFCSSRGPTLSPIGDWRSLDSRISSEWAFATAYAADGRSAMIGGLLLVFELERGLVR